MQKVTLSCPMLAPDHIGQDLPCGQRVRCADLWEHCQQHHATAPPQAAPIDEQSLTLSATVHPTAPPVFFFVSLLGSTRRKWALHASLDAQVFFKCGVFCGWCKSLTCEQCGVFCVEPCMFSNSAESNSAKFKARGETARSSE
tara:strand:+ start:83 stop:511 length:429 start_codon:yes stop_codon:yes gene_type:complete